MPIDNVKPEQKSNSDMKPIDTTSSPDNGNTPVGCSLSSLDEQLEKVYQQFYSEIKMVVDNTDLSNRNIFRNVKFLYKKASIALDREIDNYLN